MILTTNTTIACQCPQCGVFEFNSLSLFAFSGRGRKNYVCGCGVTLISISSRTRLQFNLSYTCAYCGEIHYLRLSRRAIWGTEVLPLVCPDVGASVGYIGPKQKVSHACHEREKSIGELAVELGYEEEFENPEVMLQILDHLHRLAKLGKLGCACGNHQLSFELQQDRIELYCEFCEAVGVIYADSIDNVRQIEGMNSLYIEENNTWLINRPLRGQHLVKSNEEEKKWR